MIILMLEKILMWFTVVNFRWIHIFVDFMVYTICSIHENLSLNFNETTVYIIWRTVLLYLQLIISSSFFVSVSFLSLSLINTSLLFKDNIKKELHLHQFFLFKIYFRKRIYIHINQLRKWLYWKLIQLLDKI